MLEQAADGRTEGGGGMVLTAKQVKKLQPGAMVTVITEADGKRADYTCMVCQVGIHKKLMNGRGKFWRITDTPGHRYEVREDK